MTTAQCVMVLKNFPKRIPAAVRRGMRRGLVKAGADAQRIAAQRGIMRGLLGHGGIGPVFGNWKTPGNGLIRVKSPKIVGQNVIGGLEAVGIAALQELGGRTKPHKITVGPGKRALTLKGFVHPFAVSVMHPGSTIPRHPFLEEAISKNMPTIQRDIELALQEEVVKAGDVAGGQALSAA